MFFLFTFFTIFFISNAFGLNYEAARAEAQTPLDCAALMATQQYRTLINAPQDEKDHVLKSKLEWERDYSRKDIAIALLAGANPNIRDHEPFSGGPKHWQNVRLATSFDDVSLVELFFDKGLNGVENPWSSCRSPKMAQLFIKHGALVLTMQANAVGKAITHHRRMPYIKYLLEQCPQAAQGAPRERPLLIASFQNGLEIEDGTKKDLLKLLVDHGADPYAGESQGHGMSPLQILQKDGICAASYAKENRELAPWLEEYYHVRNSLMPTVLKNRFMLLNRIFPAEITERIFGYIAADKRSAHVSVWSNPDQWRLYGKVAREYENFKRKQITHK